MEQHDKLGVTLQSDWKFTFQVQLKLCEANNCLYVIRSLRKEGYTRVQIDNLFKALVLFKDNLFKSENLFKALVLLYYKALELLNINYALPVYGASMADLNIVQCFLRQCFKNIIS